MKALLILLTATLVAGSAYGADECWNIAPEGAQVRSFVYSLDEGNRHIDLWKPISTSVGYLPAGEYQVMLMPAADTYVLTGEANLVRPKDSALIPVTLKLLVSRDPASVVSLYIEARELNAENQLKMHFAEYFYCKMIPETQD